MADEQEIDMKKEYKKIREKYTELPQYDKINREFEIFRIKDKENLVFNILRQISDYHSFFLRMLESVILPNPANLVGAYESKSFSDEDKQELTELHKELMFIEREALITHVKKDEKAAVDFIVRYWKNWEKLKKQMLNMAEKMKQSWKTEDKKHKNNYFG